MQLSHAEDFTQAAEDYQGARTPYDLKAVKRAFAQAGVGTADTVAELGPGEGGLTRVLLQHPGIKHPVYCIERDPGMRAKFKEHMAKEIEEGKVVLIEGSAEQTNLPDGVKPKLFIGGDMAHWISPEAGKELKAKLKPGGKIAFITRYPDGQDPIVWKLHELLLSKSEIYREPGANPLAARPGAELDLKQAKHIVADAEEFATPFIDMRSKEELFVYLRSRSSTREFCKPKRLDGESDAAYAPRIAAAKKHVFDTVIDPLFEYAKEQGRIEQVDGVEKIPLQRVEFVTVGRPRVAEQAKGHTGHAKEGGASPLTPG